MVTNKNIDPSGNFSISSRMNVTTLFVLYFNHFSSFNNLYY